MGLEGFFEPWEVVACFNQFVEEVVIGSSIGKECIAGRNGES